jgi:hypothetical protein
VFILRSDSLDLTYLCAVNGVQWWGTSVRYALRFKTKKRADNLCSILRESTAWATKGNLRVVPIVKGKPIEMPEVRP